MNRLTALALFAFLAALCLTGCGVDQGLHDRLAAPEIIQQVARQEAARADAEQAKADALAAEAESLKNAADAQAARDQLAQSTEAQAQPAAIWGKRAAYLGAGLAAGLVALSFAFAFACWATLRASTISPTAGGQFPLIRVGGFGFAGFVDPNRTTGLTIFKTPTVFDVVAVTVRQLQGQPVKLAAPVIDQPLVLSESGTLTMLAQAAAVAMTGAATRWPNFALPSKISEAVNAIRTATLALPFPIVEEEDPDHVDRLLELTGEVIED